MPERILPLGERHLRTSLREFATHYHRERNHQGLGNVLIDRSGPQPATGRICRRRRVGGILSYYYRSAGRDRSVEAWDSTGSRDPLVHAEQSDVP